MLRFLKSFFGDEENSSNKTSNSSKFEGKSGGGNEPKELTKDEEAKLALEREKFRALGESVEGMTIAEIISAVGGSERSTKTKLIRANLSCIDYDGRKVNAKISAADGLETTRHSLMEEHGNLRRFGLVNAALICPHCQTKGKVRNSVGVDEAVLTISNNYKAKPSTKMHCDECGVDWSV